MKTATFPQSVGRDGELHVSRADVIAIARKVRAVYENAQLLADEGVIDFDVLDLTGALVALDRLVGRDPP